MDVTTVKCNNCDSDDFEILFPAGKAQVHRIVKCNNCGLMYANPQNMDVNKSIKILEEERKGDNQQYEDEFQDYTPDNIQYLNKQYVQQRDYTRILDYINQREKGKLLEIGCNAGVFLNNAKMNGWDVLGVEPETLPRIYAQRRFGLDVLADTFESAEIENESLDVIISTHVIEHVSDPKQFVEKTNKLLKKGGMLVLETPSYDNLTFKLLQHRERSIRHDGHIFFYTKRTLRDLIESCGFSVLEHEYVGRTLTLDRLFTNIGIILGNRNILSKFSKRIGMQRIRFHVRTNDMQRIYCEKKT